MMDSLQQTDDGDALVAELLQRFLGSGTTPAQPAGDAHMQHTSHNDDTSALEKTGVTHTVDISDNDDAFALEKKSSDQILSAVEIPTIRNPDEYEFLPGHYDVRYIISETSDEDQGTAYRVKLRSGEIETIPSPRLHTLNNAEEALQYFNTYGSPEYSSSISSCSAVSSEDEYAPSSSGARLRRTGLSNRARGQFTAFFGSDNESGRSEEGDSSDDELVSSSAAKHRRLRPRRAAARESRRRARKSTLDRDIEDHAPMGTRFSTRRRNVVRHNLRDRLEDDISERESSEKEGRFFGAREVFHRIPRDDWFRLHHRNACEVCYAEGDDYEKGPLVFCQGCTSAYHQNCLGARAARDHLVTKVADDQFILQCRRCLGIPHTKDPLSPHQGCCTKCAGLGKMSKPLRERLTSRQEQQLRQNNGGKDPITAVDMNRVNNVLNLLFRCVRCHRGFHFEHLPPKTVELLAPEDFMRTRFEEYSPSWQCHDCSSAPGQIDVMVAWRPTDPRSLPPGSTASVMKESDKEYLIKWKGKSYYRTIWMPGTWVWGVVNSRMRVAFFKSSKNCEPFMKAEDAIPEEFLRVDIVFDVRYSDTPGDRTVEGDLARVDKVQEAYVKFKGLPYEDVVWESPPDISHTERWNDFKAAYNDWVWRDYVHVPNPDSLRKHLAEVRKQNFKATLVLDKQPDNMTGGKIMDYQKDGLNWLYYMWFKQNNAILADEMGLGKTIQVIGLFATLIQYHKCWPFLVVAPNPTCPNWRREIRSWAPSIRVVTYYGSQHSRKLAHDYEMFAEGSKGLACHVVVTSYETMIDDTSRKMLSKVPWAGLIVDEGQRLKNDKSQIYAALSRMKIPFRLLLTGTPLQNNTRELFNLIQFCDPTKDAEALESQYGTLSKDNIPELHGMIRPFFLRRTKAQVLDFLPPMVQIIVPVSMSVVQKKLYKSILAKNPQLIKAVFQSGIVKQAERQNLNNILMQLRKCLCHPFVYSRAIEERTSNVAASHRHLVEASGKLQLLELMLPKLKERGHRVLLFSQFLENLDIVEDFLEGLGLLYRRLDGRMSSLEKQKQIDEYNAEGSPYFAFLLSTRSGGVGINLATADTVIIMDPDFNPHQDMQALSRAHRIGQKNKVLVLQLMTRGSAEEKIMQIGKKKMALDHVLIERIDEDNVGDLESILRHGAQALFEGDDSGDVHYDAEAVEKLLDRSQIEQEKQTDDAGESQFSFARVWANDNSALEDGLQDPDKEPTPPSSTVWEKILQERERAAAEEARLRMENLGRGKRKRNTVDYSVADMNESPVKPKLAKHRHGDESDGEFRAVAEEPDSDAEEPEMDSDYFEDESGKRRKVRPFTRVDPAKTDSLQTLDGNMERPAPAAPCVACNERHPVGYCRLKLAGVEHCGLCGIAHFGYARTCPHLQSEDEVRKMLEALRRSNEPRDLVKEAKRYLYGVRNDFSKRRRTAMLANAMPNQGGPTPSNAGAGAVTPGPQQQGQPAVSGHTPGLTPAPAQNWQQPSPAKPLPPIPYPPPVRRGRPPEVDRPETRPYGQVQSTQQYQPGPSSGTTPAPRRLGRPPMNPTSRGAYGQAENTQQYRPGPSSSTTAAPGQPGRPSMGSTAKGGYGYVQNAQTQQYWPTSSQTPRPYRPVPPAGTTAAPGQVGRSAMDSTGKGRYGYVQTSQQSRPSPATTATPRQRTVIDLTDEQPSRPVQRKEDSRPSPPSLD